METTYSTVIRRIAPPWVGERCTPALVIRDQGSDLFDGELQALEQASKEEILNDFRVGCQIAST